MRGYADAGFAFDLEENEPTIRCVAAPVYDAGNHVVAAISVASTVIYMPDARMQELVPHVKECAKKYRRNWAGAPFFYPVIPPLNVNILEC